MISLETIQRLTWQRALRHVRKWREPYLHVRKPDRFDFQGNEAGGRIRKLLESPEPCLIARFGNNELRTIENYLTIQEHASLPLRLRRYLRGETGPWWWDDRTAREMKRGAGFFPSTPANLERFARLSLEDCPQIDLLGSWLPAEARVASHLRAIRVPLRDLEPFFHKDPWTEVLAGHRVLVVHPFDVSIRGQYGKRQHLFADERVLPEFELLTYRSVQSMGGESTQFRDWFEALHHMEREIATLTFDIAIIGAGAYGMPLGAFIKRELGRKAVHLGGATQILFGIKGKRWDGWSRYVQELYNEHWVRPLPEETPSAAPQVEGGCYW